MKVSENDILQPVKTVWIVVKHYSDDKTLMDYSEVVGVYATEKSARAVQEELTNQNAADVIHLGCDPIDVTLEEWEIE